MHVSIEIDIASRRDSSKLRPIQPCAELQDLLYYTRRAHLCAVLTKSAAHEDLLVHLPARQH